MSAAGPLVLVVIDGFGIAPPGPGNAVHLARTPVLDALAAEGSGTSIAAAGLPVGLPDGQPVIRFMPDGYFDYASVPRFILRQGTEGALQIAPTANRLAYEVLPYAPNQP